MFPFRSTQSLPTDLSIQSTFLNMMYKTSLLNMYLNTAFIHQLLSTSHIYLLLLPSLNRPYSFIPGLKTHYAYILLPATRRSLCPEHSYFFPSYPIQFYSSKIHLNKFSNIYLVAFNMKSYLYSITSILLIMSLIFLIFLCVIAHVPWKIFNSITIILLSSLNYSTNITNIWVNKIFMVSGVMPSTL